MINRDDRGSRNMSNKGIHKGGREKRDKEKEEGLLKTFLKNVVDNFKMCFLGTPQPQYIVSSNFCLHKKSYRN